MTDPQPTATIAGQSIALHLANYPDIPNRWGPGHIRPTGLRLDYGSFHTPDARRVFVTGLWVREDGQVTEDPLDQYYDAPTGDLIGWPDWLADLTRKHDPASVVPPADRAAVLREAADVLDTLPADATSFDKAEHKYKGGAAAERLRRMADDTQQSDAQPPLTPCTCRQAIHAAEHTNRPVDDCPWCTPAPNIRPNQTAGRTITTVDARLLNATPEA